MLRGPQTPGELQSRSGRLHRFANNQQVVESLTALLNREGGPAIARLPRQAGRMDHEYAHLLSGKIESTPEEPTIVQRVSAPNRDQQISKLEARVDALENALTKLATQLGESKR